MLENLQAALQLVFTVETIFALFAGVVIGTIIGAIPGMTVTMGVALTLPFTFTMQPVTGILLLLGVYKGGIYGGSITAILIRRRGRRRRRAPCSTAIPCRRTARRARRSTWRFTPPASPISFPTCRSFCSPVSWPASPCASVRRSSSP